MCVVITQIVTCFKALLWHVICLPHVGSCNYLSSVLLTGSFCGQMLLIYQIMDVL